MSQDLVSSAPGIYEAFLALIKKAGEEQSPAVTVFAFELQQYEPAAYILLEEIANQEFEWEAIGSYWQKERYDVAGYVTVFSGDSPANNPALTAQVLTETYAIFNACVMTPAVTNRDVPILGTTGPSPFLILPGHARYSAGPAQMAKGQAGWYGKLDFSFHFEALIAPA